jgi:hypothetical protein
LTLRSIAASLAAGPALILLLVAGCSSPTDVTPLPDSIPAPAFAVVAVHFPIADPTAPQPVNPAIAIAWSDFPDPDTLNFPALRLGPAGQSVQFTVETSLAGRQLLLRPRVDLQPNLDYFVTLGDGLKSLAGQPLAAPLRLRFRTGAFVQPAAATVPPPTLAELLQPDQLLGRSCALPSCHRPTTSGGLNLPAARGLDFSGSAATLRTTLVGGRRGGLDSLLWVEPGHPERSYLLRKLLAGQGFTRIDGDPMPPFPGAAAALDDPTLLGIEAWIRSGAN